MTWQHLNSLGVALQLRDRPTIKRLEAGMNARRVILSPEDRLRYQRMLRNGRMNLTKQGVYNKQMMKLLWQFRCKSAPTNLECSMQEENYK